MKLWKVIFWTGKDYRILFIRQRTIHFVVLIVERLITCNNWELVDIL